MNHASKIIFTCVAIAALAATVADTASAMSAEEKCEPPAFLSRESTPQNLFGLPILLFRDCGSTQYENLPARRLALRHAKAKKQRAQTTHVNALARSPVYRPMIVLGVAW